MKTSKTGLGKLGVEKYQCPHCELKFKSKTSYNEHLKSHMWHKITRR
jgi:uncharacterized C2H2 Zn-finger protein